MLCPHSILLVFSAGDLVLPAVSTALFRDRPSLRRWRRGHLLHQQAALIHVIINGFGETSFGGSPFLLLRDESAIAPRRIKS